MREREREREETEKEGGRKKREILIIPMRARATDSSLSVNRQRLSSALVVARSRLLNDPRYQAIPFEEVSIADSRNFDILLLISDNSDNRGELFGDLLAHRCANRVRYIFMGYTHPLRDWAAWRTHGGHEQVVCAREDSAP